MHNRYITGYFNQLSTAKRGIAIVDKKYVVVRDELQPII
jgi:hypothetical protein